MSKFTRFILSAGLLSITIALIFSHPRSFAQTPDTATETPASETPQAQADRLRDLSWQQYTDREYQSALESFDRALVLYRELGDLRGEGVILSNIGQVYNALDDLDRAIDYYQQSLALFRQTGYLLGEAASLGNLGMAYRAKEEHERALEYFQQAIDASENLDTPTGEGWLLQMLGSTYQALGEVDTALDYYQQYLDLAREKGDRASEEQALFLSRTNVRRFDRPFSHSRIARRSRWVGRSRRDRPCPHRNRFGFALGNGSTEFEPLCRTRSSECLQYGTGKNHWRWCRGIVALFHYRRGSQFGGFSVGGSRSSHGEPHE
ncbi:tetratricopeptide repeat protein [Oscillatoriales cyanobacterium LEGE 11467]|uniref:Tetratricopeptide repeat protein n=1 Tax=Zarconia navalis LEGE 11467 TaxID=1828826 RepID=A0A928Z7Z0_9CYAN|nr:tetratricopeptide repeat protein [Zarconia navalis LEGE 11467]